MKIAQYLGHTYVSIPLLVLLVISPVGMVAAAGASAGQATCDQSTVAAKISHTSVPYTEQNAINLAETSATLINAISGYTATYSTIGTNWKENPTCSVSFLYFSVTYLLTAMNNSRFLLSLRVNPGTGDVFNAGIRTFASHSYLPWNNTSTTYSGYAIAQDGFYDPYVNYTQVGWWIPTIQAPSGGSCGLQYNSPPACELAEWTGLQNSTYDGMNHVTVGEVIQTGTDAYCNTDCSFPAYSGWAEYLNGNLNGVQQNLVHSCSNAISGGDDMYGEVANQKIINGTTGKTFYTYLYDYKTNVWCNWHVSPSTSCGSSTCKIAGKEIFADYFVETPQFSSSHAFMLPKFRAPYLDYLFFGAGMYAYNTGTYPYYNSGDWLYSYMKNCSGGTCVQNTYVTTMINGNGNQASFNESWKSSQYTGL